MAIRPPQPGDRRTPRLNLVLFMYGMFTTAALVHNSFNGAKPAARGGGGGAGDAAALKQQQESLLREGKQLVDKMDSALGAVDKLVNTLPAQLAAKGSAVATRAEPCPVCPACKAGSSTGSGGAGMDGDNEIYISPLNLLDIFDKPQSLSSVSSTAFMAYRCVPPLRETLRGASEAELTALQASILKEILALVAEAKGGGATAASISSSVPLLEALGAQGYNAPAYLEARATISDLAVSYALHIDGRAMCCAAAASSSPVALADAGKQKCAPREGTDCLGFLSAGYISQPLDAVALTIVQRGWCSDPPEYIEGYANHMAKTKMFNSTWKLFNVPTLEQDAVIQMFQLLYEARTVFLRQHWLGVVAMQNPFDAWSIQDIIYTLKPDVIIETGTANGGSAIMWASILHLMGHPGRVVTLDLAEPTEITWAQKRDNPRENPLWKQYVTFIRGSTLEADTMAQVKEITKDAKTVFVMLDSNHETNHVRQEIGLYCPLTTVGSYCLVQDGKLSRIGWIGPYPAIQEWLAANPNWEADRSRELLFTDHPSGYMKRLS